MTRLIDQAEALRALREIPGVGKEIAQDLLQLGVRSVGHLRGKDPERLYRRHCLQKGGPVDRCMLYVFRCATYYASTRRPNPELLRWWNWSDAKIRLMARKCG